MICWIPVHGMCEEPAHAEEYHPLVLYYSRTGTSAVVAHEISARLACNREEVRSKKNRFYLGTFTCVFDQLFDRDDENEPSHINLADYDPIIIVSPVWIHMLASPMRTYLKQHSLRNKTVYVIATNQGNYTCEKDEQNIRSFLAGLGASVREIRGIMTKGKAWEIMRQEAQELISRTIVRQN
jgi:menaquinone-dependent protoporphyrinogen IX oxidase